MQSIGSSDRAGERQMEDALRGKDNDHGSHVLNSVLIVLMDNVYL